MISQQRAVHLDVMRQEYDRFTAGEGKAANTPAGPFEKQYVHAFDHANMFRLNKFPPISVAFPHWIFHNYGLRFDEILTTTEDWDFIMGLFFYAALNKPRRSPEYTAGARWRFFFRTEHSGEECEKTNPE